MASNPLDLPPPPAHLYSLAQTNHLTFSALEYALRKIGTIPEAEAWQRFIDNMLLLLGTTLLLAGVIFFFAYNWADMAHFAKFCVLQVGVLSMALLALLLGLERLSAQAALLAAAVLLGALLAVYGQTYQTGADAFNLFLVWAILIIPWVLLGVFAPLWSLLLLLLNLSLILYWEQVINPPSFAPRTELFLLLFLLNGIAMVAWEYAHKQGVAWLQGQWFGILIFGAVLTALIIPTLFAIADLEDWQANRLFAVSVLLYVVTTLLALWYYRYQRRDLLRLAMSLLGVIIVFTTFMGKILPLDTITWLILALVIIGQAALATKWLQQVAKT